MLNIFIKVSEGKVAMENNRHPITRHEFYKTFQDKGLRGQV